MQATQDQSTVKHKSACNLCSLNCGIEIEVNPESREFVSIKGDPDHPLSQGYICQKATRINYYQNGIDRLDSPLKRTESGEYEKISWDQAIEEIAAKLITVRDSFGGTSIAYAGGGGQGNHMGGVYGSSLRAACQTPYIYSSLAQEKTGNFWVHGRLFGRQNTMYAEPVEDADYVIIIGANPMQSHGIHRARKVIGELSRDPNRTLVVIDPRLTETAKKADHFLQVKPGRDAWLLTALLAHIIQNDLVDHTFLQEHTLDYEVIKPHFTSIDVEAYATIAGITMDQIQTISDGIHAAKCMTVRSDLGIEMSYNSTLNAYLKRLLFLITGHFGKHGTNHLTTWFFPLLGHSKDPEDGGITTQVTQTRGIGKLFPPNVLPLEIDSDHPDRIRALIVDSANPVSSWADTKAQMKAYRKLDLMVVIDVAMTETAKEAHYVLPASSTYEKCEATFFAENFFHLRKPVIEPLEGTLSEPEIYTRLIRAMGEIPVDFPELEQAASKDAEEPGKGHFQQAFMKASFENASLKKHGPVILKETMGKTLEEGSEAAGLLWVTSQMFANKYPHSIRRAGFEGNSSELANQMFQKILNSPSGVVLSERDYADHWKLIKHADNRVHLHIPELLEWLDKLPEQDKEISRAQEEFPYNLIAGERRSYNANTIIRNPKWRKKDAEGSLKINPEDALSLGIETGDTTEITSETGTIKLLTHVTDEVPRGVASMPHGHGLAYGDAQDYTEVGAMANLLTSTTSCDPLAKTPYHKNVRVKLRKVS